VEVYEPHTALGLVGLILLGVPVFGAAAIPAWIAHRAAKRNGQKVGAVLHQVENNHETNLRDDIDDITTAVLSLSRDISGLHTDVRSLRDELRVERTDRIEGDARITEHINLEIHRTPE
jgi:hypothetical protein